MPPRTVKRRGTGQRWLLLPLVLTMLVLLVDASMHARSPRPAITLSRAAWVDKVLPQIALSSTQGLEIAYISNSALSEGSRPATEQLSAVASSAWATYRSVARAVPPPALVTAAGFLQACLEAREKGAAAMASAASLLVGTGKSAAQAAVRQMNTASSDFAVSDNAYDLFAAGLPKLGLTMPTSRWDAPSGNYSTKGFEAFAARLAAGVAHTAQHQLAIDAVSTDPTALSMQGSVQVLPPAAALAVTVVVADTGMSPESGVIVSVSISPGRGGRAQRQTATVDLQPGGAKSVVIVGLVPERSTPTQVAVMATPPGGQPGAASRSLSIEMAGAHFDQATTTVPPTATATAPGARAGGAA